MRAMFFVAILASLLGLVLGLTGYKPGIGYGPEPKDEVCAFDRTGQLTCEERDR